MGILVFGQNAGAERIADPYAPRRGFFSRLAGLVIKARQKAVDKQIARHLARNPDLARKLRDNGDIVWKQAADALPF